MGIIRMGDHRCCCSLSNVQGSLPKRVVCAVFPLCSPTPQEGGLQPTGRDQLAYICQFLVGYFPLILPHQQNITKLSQWGVYHFLFYQRISNLA